MRSSPQGLARSSLLDAESALSAHPGMTVYSIMPGTRVRLCRPEHKPCAGHPRLRDLAAIKTWVAGTSPAMTRGDDMLCLAPVIPGRGR